MKAIPQSSTSKWIFIFTTVIFISLGCQKIDWLQPGKDIDSQKKTRDYSSELVVTWMKMQLELTRTSSTPLFLNPFRHFAYCGIALYESVVPGMPGYKSLAPQLNELIALPETDHSVEYNWPTCANASLAAMNRYFFPSSSVKIDSLEDVFNMSFKNEISNEVFQRSADFGKAIAQAVSEWSKTDGSATMIDPSYVPPTGPGLWVPTPPGFANAVGPHWGNNRLFVKGSLIGSEPPPPPDYSEDPGSPFFAMVKDVYDVSIQLTPDQVATALYYRESPGFGNAHSLSTTMQVLQQEAPSLDMAAVTYAKAGIAVADASIGCWAIKFQYNQVRPITYIRNVMNQPNWNAQFNTPPHPEFSSAHIVIAAALAATLSNLFGANYHFTDHSYDYLGMPARSFNSFEEMAEEIAIARVYAGIHYRYSCVVALTEGKKIAKNINDKLKFKN